MEFRELSNTKPCTAKVQWRAEIKVKIPVSHGLKPVTKTADLLRETEGATRTAREHFTSANPRLNEWGRAHQCVMVAIDSVEASFPPVSGRFATSGFLTA